MQLTRIQQEIADTVLGEEKENKSQKAMRIIVSGGGDKEYANLLGKEVLGNGDKQDLQKARHVLGLPNDAVHNKRGTRSYISRLLKDLSFSKEAVAFLIEQREILNIDKKEKIVSPRVSNLAVPLEPVIFTPYDTPSGRSGIYSRDFDSRIIIQLDVSDERLDIPELKNSATYIRIDENKKTRYAGKSPKRKNGHATDKRFVEHRDKKPATLSFILTTVDDSFNGEDAAYQEDYLINEYVGTISDPKQGFASLNVADGDYTSLPKHRQTRLNEFVDWSIPIMARQVRGLFTDE